MIKVLFICHGNICRSPMAEFVFKDLVRREHLADLFQIDSAATSGEELGNPVYPPARKMLQKHGLSCSGKYAVRTTRADYDRYDYIIAMDRQNLRWMDKIYGGDPDGKISLLMDYTDRPGNVADPWYTGDFQATWEDVTEGCAGLLEYLRAELHGV